MLALPASRRPGLEPGRRGNSFPFSRRIASGVAIKNRNPSISGVAMIHIAAIGIGSAKTELHLAA
jgi:hypothetical protein